MNATSAYEVPNCMTAEEAILEDIRTLILGGILFVEDFDQDDVPIAARIAAANDMVSKNGAAAEQAKHAGEHRRHSFLR